MENKLYTKDQIKDAIWQELKESGYAGDNNDRAYEIIGIVMAGIEKINAMIKSTSGLPPLDAPILGDTDLKAWESDAVGREEDAAVVFAKYLDEQRNSVTPDMWAEKVVWNKPTAFQEWLHYFKQQKEK